MSVYNVPAFLILSSTSIERYPRYLGTILVCIFFQWILHLIFGRIIFIALKWLLLPHCLLRSGLSKPQQKVAGSLGGAFEPTHDCHVIIMPSMF